MSKNKSSKNTEKPQNTKKSLAQLLHRIKPYRWKFLLVFIFAIFSAILTLITPEFLKEMSNTIIIGGTNINIGKISTYGSIITTIFCISAVFDYLQGIIVERITAHITKQFRTDISKKINNLPLNYFDTHATGDVLSRVTNDVDTLGSSLSSSACSAVVELSLIIGSFIMMMVNSPLLTLVVIAIMPISILLVLLIVKISQKYFVKQQVELGNINGKIEEIYSANDVVTLYNGQDKEQKSFDKINKELFHAGYKAQFFSRMLSPIMMFIGNVIYVAVCVTGAAIAIKNNDPIFVTTIVAFVTYMRTFNNQIGNFANISSTIQSTAAASERVFEFLNEEEQSAEKTTHLLKKVKGNIEFKHVDFGYNPDKIIIKDFNAKIKAGQKIAIVGPTGAGKTTLVNLLMRFYELNSGDITIDGISIKKMSRNEVRSLFGMVLQDSWIFEGTVKENIVYGTSGLSDDDIHKACEFAHINHLIRSLPNGYETVISEKSNISQGQKQLLTIARVITNNSPMIILDEATSSVDTRTETLIQEAMDKLMQNRTSFIIAHRLSTIKNADLILVLKDGNIVEQGTHDELINTNSFYATLYNSQFSNTNT